MNTLGASLASFRPAAETPAGRGGRDDEGSAVFGALLGALSEDSAPGPAATAQDDASTEPGAVEALAATGDSSLALTLLAAIDSSAPKPTSPDVPAPDALVRAMLPEAAGPRAGGDPIEALIARALPPAIPASPAAPGGLGRVQVAVIAQETHFAPVKPHAVGLMAVLPATVAAPASDGVPIATLDAAGARAALVPAPAASALPAHPPGTATLVPIASAQPEWPGDPVLHLDDAQPAKAEASTVSHRAGSPSIAVPASPSGGDARAVPGQPAAVSVSSPAAAPAVPQAVLPASAMAAVASVLPAQPVAPVPAPGGAGQPRRDGPARETPRVQPETIATVSVVAVEPDASKQGAPELRQEPPSGTGPAVSLGMAASPLAPAAAEPTRQVAAAILDQMGRLPAASPVAGQTVADGPLRLLTIQLRPDELGTVLVRMRLRGDQLEMSLHASREETAALLRSDGAALNDLLRGAGYKPDIVTIGAVRADPQAMAEPGRSGAGAGFSAQDGPSGGQGGAASDQSGRRQPEQPDARRAGQTKESRGDDATSTGSGRLGRYL